MTGVKGSGNSGTPYVIDDCRSRAQPRPMARLARAVAAGQGTGGRVKCVGCPRICGIASADYTAYCGLLVAPYSRYAATYRFAENNTCVEQEALHGNQDVLTLR